MGEIMITAHSGCEGTPRDSLESVDFALSYAADAVEVDVRMDGNGVLRISHDKKSEEAYQSCATFRSLLEKIAGTHLKLNCDMKEAELTHEVIAMAKEYGLDRRRLWMTGAISPEQLAREPSLLDHTTVFMNAEEILKFIYIREGDAFSYPEFRELMNTPWGPTRKWMEEITPDIVNKTAILIRNVGADGLNIPQWKLTDELFLLFANENIPLSIWTVDLEPVARMILTQRQSTVRNITTRQVRMVKQVMEEIG